MPQRLQFITYTFQILLSTLKWDSTFANRAALLFLFLHLFFSFFPFKVKNCLKQVCLRLSSQFMLNDLSCAVSKTGTETLSSFPGILCTAWGMGLPLLLQHPLSLSTSGPEDFFLMQKGVATGWCLHNRTRSGRSFQEQRKVSYAIKVLQCLLLSSFLHDILGKNSGRK